MTSDRPGTRAGARIPVAPYAIAISAASHSRRFRIFVSRERRASSNPHLQGKPVGAARPATGSSGAARRARFPHPPRRRVTRGADHHPLGMRARRRRRPRRVRPGRHTAGGPRRRPRTRSAGGGPGGKGGRVAKFRCGIDFPYPEIAERGSTDRSQLKLARGSPAVVGSSFAGRQRAGVPDDAFGV